MFFRILYYASNLQDAEGVLPSKARDSYHKKIKLAFGETRA